MTSPDPSGTARVVLLSGPSGAGKTRLAERLAGMHGWPIVRLDDFYRNADDPALPRSAGLGIPDWDHPDSWHRGAAVAALVELIETGTTSTPVYDLGRSRAVATARVRARPADLVVAEGIFAAEIARELRRRGLLHSAWCVHGNRFRTAAWRLVRDVREHRKPLSVLVRRGWALIRAEPAIVARATRQGATPATVAEVERALARHRNAPSAR